MAMLVGRDRPHLTPALSRGEGVNFPLLWRGLGEVAQRRIAELL